MKRALPVFALAFCLLAMAKTPALADPMMRCERMCKFDKMWSKMDLGDMFIYKAHFILSNAEELGLSDDQVDKIIALKLNAKKSLIKYDADIDTFALDIMSELKKDDININMINAMIDKKYAVKTQRAKDIIAACVNIRKILTDEQRKKLKDMLMTKMMDQEKCPMAGEDMPMMRKKGMDN